MEETGCWIMEDTGWEKGDLLRLIVIDGD